MKTFLRRVLPLSSAEIPRAAIVFAVYYVTAIFGLYIYYTYETSPALIWPAVGVALVSTIFWGYRMWFPIFVAHLVAQYSLDTGVPFVSVISAAAYALEAIVGAYALKRFDVDRNLPYLKDMTTLVVILMVVTALAPLVITLARMFLDLLTIHPVINLGRSWGGGMFSALVLVPFMLSWFPWRDAKHFSGKRKQALEIVAAFALIFAANHLLFATEYLQIFGIAVIFILPAALVWLGLRFHPRWMTLALLVTATQAITGTIFVHVIEAPISQQLLSVQLYVGFVAAIFLIFSSVVEDRRVAYKRLEKAFASTFAEDKAKNEFIAILAHELRNPLAPIVSSLEYTKLQTKNPVIREAIGNAETHADMMRRLLDDLLDTVRLTRSKILLKKEFVELRPLVLQCVASVEDFSRSRNQTLRVDQDTEETILDADPVRLKQVVINLLNNACKYTQRGGRIELRTEKRNGYAVIHVSDNGAGVDPRDISNIFEPFRQTQRAAERGTGLGIGLFLTKQIAEMHGGRIQVASEGPRKGSTFSLYMPLAKGTRPISTAIVENTKNGNKKVLIVDDNEIAANMLQKLLTIRGYAADVAYTGEDAVRKALSTAPQLILLDIGMPVMDGYETARRLRTEGWRGTLVALSGYGQEADKKRTAAEGFGRHLVKPVRVTEIIEVLQSIEV